ncbi:MAG TPA: hypothetical protein VM577_15635, partial [Anaerovoracaceae bacterium]|nr:hypothetical protein [Anaerovoracaceae bacterium]
MKKISIIILAVLIIAVGICIILPPLLHEDKQEVKPSQSPVEVPEEAVMLNISAVGDVMVHKPQIPAQYDSETGT